MLSVIKVTSMNEGKEKKPSGKKVNVWAIILIVSAIYVLTRLVRSLFSMSAYQYAVMINIICLVCFAICIIIAALKIIKKKTTFSGDMFLQLIAILLLLVVIIIRFKDM